MARYSVAPTRSRTTSDAGDAHVIGMEGGASRPPSHMHICACPEIPRDAYDGAMSQNTNVTEYVTAGDDAQESALPWSYRQRPWLRYLIDVVSGAALGIVGTFAHRMGAAQNIPYGLVLALLLVALGAWSARSRDGVAGFALYFIASTTVLYFLALRSGDVLIAAGFASDSLPFWSQHAGYSWLFGVVVVQLLLLVFPRRFFSMPTRRVGRRKSENDSGTDD